MHETIHLLILANSIRPGGHCVAGKSATPLENGLYDVNERWIRLVDPHNPNGGVPYGCTVCQGNKAVRPLDMIKVVLLDSCNNPDHPEDWYFDRSQPWEMERTFENNCLPAIADTPATLWHDGISSNAVPSGFVCAMKPHPFSICLIPAPAKIRSVTHQVQARFKKSCSRGLMGNVFGEAPNTAGEGARAPPKSRHFNGYSFHENALARHGEFGLSCLFP
ncbi:MAG: hypothetical protein ABSF38_04825 [Verrucomicrobiota bacterium]